MKERSAVCKSTLDRNRARAFNPKGYRTPPTTASASAGPRQTPRSGQLDNEIIFLCEDDANEASPTIQFMSPKDDTDEA